SLMKQFCLQPAAPTKNSNRPSTIALERMAFHPVGTIRSAAASRRNSRPELRRSGRARFARWLGCKEGNSTAYIGSSSEDEEENFAGFAGGSGRASRPQRAAGLIAAASCRRLTGSGKFLPARRNGDAGQAQQPLDAGPLADVVAFSPVANVLQQI